MTRSTLRRAVLTFAASTLFSTAPSFIHAQGCAQCRDNAASTPPATQRAYRHAIFLLTLTASGIFVTAVTMLRRSR
jgi:hypothetical protein